MLLREGVERWNHWRKEEPDVRPDLREANLRGAKLYAADLSYADLRGDTLRGAYLGVAELRDADLSGADLSGADLGLTRCVGTNFSHATLTGCNVYGISVWDVNLEGAVQEDLRITPGGEVHISVDNLKVAQFLYLLLNNEEVRAALDTLLVR
jgi:uncharacterized protein YjbI with pentapeptide repeats